MTDIPETPTMNADAELMFALSRALGYPRSARAVSAAVSAGGGTNLSALQETARLLGFEAEVEPAVPEIAQAGIDGAIVFEKAGRLVAVWRSGDATGVFPESAGEPARLLAEANRAGRLLAMRPLEDAAAGSVMYEALRRRTRRGMVAAFWQSLLINGLALTVPFFSMLVYNRVLGGGAVSTLPAVMWGLAVVLVILMIVRHVRARLVAAEYARISALVDVVLMRRFLTGRGTQGGRLPPERQRALSRQAAGASGVFSSANVMAIYDGPFIVLSIIAVLVVGGSLALIPVILLALAALIALSLGGDAVRPDPELAAHSRQRNEIQSELDLHATELRRSGLASGWLSRFDQTVRGAVRSAIPAQVHMSAVQAVGSAVGSIIALVTLAVGVTWALEGRLSPGVLIGTMLITWRITGPAQAVFLGVPRFRQIRQAWALLKRLLSQPGTTVAAGRLPFPEGAVSVDAKGLYHKYEGALVPALSGVSFKIEPGQVALVLGPNGSGKSSLLSVLAGATRAQSGLLQINGRAASQYDPLDWSLAVSYLPTQSALSGADTADLSEAETELRAWERATQAGAPIYILDDPLAIGDAAGRDRITGFVKAMRGKATIIIATHQTDLAGLADTAIVLEQGGVVYAGPVQQPQGEPPKQPSTEPEEKA